ncbi:MAG TPA: Hsp33 family molecular chaperone HslO [Patescibacteria group bacterium]|nr:Hsp33 family molecular chaperone HslO [Patescibacteria group bacterium]
MSDAAAELKKKFLKRDRVLRVITKDGKFRAAAIKNTEIARIAQQRHALDPLAATLLARLMSGASLMSSFLKGEERITIETDSTGVIKLLFAESLQVGEVRGFVRYAKDAGERPVATIGDALGIGLLKVSKVQYNQPEPTTGIVQLIKGDISTDLAYYLRQSEQIPSAVVLDVDVDDSGKIAHSAGLLVQAMPGATEAEVKKIMDSIRELPSLAELLGTGYNPEEILRQALPMEFDVTSSTPIDFYCRCSLDRFKEMLMTLGISEIEDMQKQGQNELICQYCNEHYYLSENDFDVMLAETRARTN